MKNIVAITGAGISAESGIKTFRDANGLWEGHDVMEVASINGFKQNPEIVLSFYNERRKQLHKVKPNAAHSSLVKLESCFNVTIITQNVDDLHERAGSKNVLHLHGELFKARPVNSNNSILWKKDIKLGDTDSKGAQLRPDIVWFGEDVPLMDKAIALISKADIVLIIGTSLQVYPAASLTAYANTNAVVYYIDPNPKTQNYITNCTIIAQKATNAVPILVDDLIDTFS